MTVNEIKFTGEFMVPGKCETRIEADHLKRYDFVSRYCMNQRVLDVACGYGYGSQSIGASLPEYYLGIDINNQLIENAIAQYGNEVIGFKVGSIIDLGLSEEIDIAICFETIEHVNEYEKAIASLFKALIPGGLLFISSPNRPVTSPLTKSISDAPGNPFHTQEFTPKELRQLLIDAGFDQKSCQVYGQRLSFRYSLPSHLKRLTTRLLGDPFYEKSPKPRRYQLRQPAYFVLAVRKPFR